MTYQNFTPMEEWEIYFFEVQSKICRIFWCHFAFTAIQLVITEDTIFVTKPHFFKPLLIIITAYQIILRDINEKKTEKGSKSYLKFRTMLAYLNDILFNI